MSKPAWEPTGPHCRHCGAAVARRIARVVGANDDTVPRCRHCTEGVTRTTAAAARAHTDGFRVAPEGRR
jgi:predicted protein tyrosine phosphatase